VSIRRRYWQGGANWKKPIAQNRKIRNIKRGLFSSGKMTMIKWKLVRSGNYGYKLWVGKYGKFSMSIHKYGDRFGLFYEVYTDNLILAKGQLLNEDIEICKKLAEFAAKELYSL
jgi:hypothetical protein